MSAYTDRVEKGLEGLKFVSTGICPGCEECRRQFGFETFEALAELAQAYERGYCDEGSFSWRGCEVCHSPLGGDFTVWHGVNSENEIEHFNRACVDCVVYLANGDEPKEDEAFSARS